MGLFTFRRQAVHRFPCDASLLYEVLTDYDSYSEWVPLVSQSKLLAREGDLAIAELDLNGPEKLDVECVHTRERMVLIRSMGEKSALAKVQWDITPVSDNETEVALLIEGRSNWLWLASVARRLTRADRWLDALHARLSVYLPEVSGAGPDGEKILELVETSEGLVCWFRGTRYVMRAESEAKT